jgi:hypothetical protein
VDTFDSVQETLFPYKQGVKAATTAFTTFTTFTTCLNKRGFSPLG